MQLHRNNYEHRVICFSDVGTMTRGPEGSNTTMSLSTLVNMEIECKTSI